MVTYTVGQVVKVTHEGRTMLGVVQVVRGEDDVDVDVMVPVNVQRVTITPGGEASAEP